MVINSLLRLQNAEVGLIPSKKFEFWCDHEHLEKVRALKNPEIKINLGRTDSPVFWRTISEGSHFSKMLGVPLFRAL